MDFQPNSWHACAEDDYKECEEASNCYSYALNEPKYFWSVPGLGFVKAKTKDFFASFNAYFNDFSFEDFRKELIQGAIEDGLIPINQLEERPGYYPAALFFPEDGYDFHWLRRDDDGTWSHKDGWRIAKNSDDNGKVITDPQKVILAEYPIFGGFFLVPRSGVMLAKKFPMIPSD